MSTDNSTYGYCPACNAKGKLRERRINGNDVCENQHTYPSRDAIESAPLDAHDKCPYCGDKAVFPFEGDIIDMQNGFYRYACESRNEMFGRSKLCFAREAKQKSEKERDELLEEVREELAKLYSANTSAIDLWQQNKLELAASQAENAELKEEIETLQLRHAAVMLHTQTVVDENTKLRDIAERAISGMSNLLVDAAIGVRPHMLEKRQSQLNEIRSEFLPLA